MRRRVPARQAMALMALFGCASAVWAGVVCDNDINYCPGSPYNCTFEHLCPNADEWCEAHGGLCGAVWVNPPGIFVNMYAWYHYRDHKWKRCEGPGQEVVFCSSCSDCYLVDEDPLLMCCTYVDGQDDGCPTEDCD